MVFGFPGRWNGRLTVDLPVVALPLAALAHWIRGAPTDAVIFVVVTLLLVLAELRGTDDATMPAQPMRVPGFAVIALGLLVLAFGRDSLPVAVVICAIGLLVLVAELRDPSLPQGGPVPRRAWVWSAVGLSWCLWELISFIYEQGAGGLSLTHPTMSDLIEPMLSNRIVQALAFMGWLAAGLAMLRAAAAARRS
ncbi:hypothetical protein [Actinocrispum wychmicini]|uniref:Uncharacterized protein n=1 Tax=Actinocrispum wychmicini TaxID=1213861 RepID=A0A4R2JPA6_9PSEU|nr:hypothetical protein [Actinocrispum wychmicini]TCO60592.1 hypothetical protein EV192_103167 [Actinocrispum wychmicini]